MPGRLQRVGSRAGIVALALLLCSGEAYPKESVAATIRRMTGARTRIVWIRSSGGIGHPFGPHKGEAWSIMALDTDDGGRERSLLAERGDYNHVMMTPTGTRVIWSDCSGHVWIANWDGTGARKLLDMPLAVGVAEDPPGAEWVYVDTGKRVRASNSDQIGEIVRFRIDDTSVRELVWDKTASNDKWEFTRDGKHGASGFPWPHAGIASLPNGKFNNVGDGCTPGLADDASLVMHMKGLGHSGIFVYNADGSNQRYIDFRSQAPGIDGVPDPQFWWASFARYDRRFFTFSGPHPSMGYRQSKGNIYFCQFTPGFDGVAAWVQVTDFPEVETCGYAWIDSKKTPGPLEGVIVDASAAGADGGASVTVDLVVRNSRQTRFAGGAELVMPNGWASRLARVQFSVPPGSNGNMTLSATAPATVTAGRIPAGVRITDVMGGVVDWIPLALEVRAPVVLTPLPPGAGDGAGQPLSVSISNATDKPVGGWLRLELEGPEKLPAIEGLYGAVPAGGTVTVALTVPGLALGGSVWTARYSTVVDSVLVVARQRLEAERYWMVLGPFPNPPGDNFNNDWNAFGGKGFDYVFEPEKGVDLTREYPLPKDLAPPRDFALPEGRTSVRWGAVPAGKDGYVDLAYPLNPNSQAVAFAVVYVKSPDARKALLSLGSDDFIKTWVNGKLVVSRHVYRPAGRGQDRVTVDLQAGWNEILLKVGTGFGGWGFFFEVLSPDGGQMPDLVIASSRRG